MIYSSLVDGMTARIADVLDVLEYDGYLEATEGSHRFPSNLLKDWWSARLQHHIPIENRRLVDKSQERI